jgi:hypothetical protein
MIAEAERVAKERVLIYAGLEARQTIAELEETR